MLQLMFKSMLFIPQRVASEVRLSRTAARKGETLYIVLTSRT